MNRFSLFTTIFLLFFGLSLTAQTEVVITDGDLQTDTYTWTKENTYLLTGKVVLERGGKLTIEAGTTILAPRNGGLVIKKGAQLFAEGTAAAPIIFTTNQAQASTLDTLIQQKGLWRGIRIKGEPGFNSGSLAYVSIRQAGQFLNDLDEAGLVLEEVDKATSIQYIEVAASDLDGIKIKGGNVDIANAAVFLASDDSFDWDGGWQGNGLNWFSYLGGPRDTIGYNSYAIEGKGGMEVAEKSKPNIFNATLIGGICRTSYNEDLQFGNQAAAIYLGEQTQGIIANSVINNFPLNGIGIEDLSGKEDSREAMETGDLVVSHNIWWDFAKSTNTFQADGNILAIADSSEDANATFLTNHLLEQENIIDGLPISASIESAFIFRFSLDPRLTPNIRNKQYTNLAYPAEPLFANLAPTQEKGAFAEGVWIENWTMLDVYGEIARKEDGKTFFKDRELGVGDTLRVYCEDQSWVQDSILYYPFYYDLTGCRICPPAPGQSISADRSGNKRRRPFTGTEILVPRSKADTENYAFYQEWHYPREAHFVNSCVGDEKELDLVILYFDTLAPIIHLIPDENGQLTAFAEDCDEAAIISSTKDTINQEGQTIVRHTFIAEDYSKNQSTLTVETVLGGDAQMWYADLDGDGYGNPDLPIMLTNPLAGFAPIADDCNDESALIYPNSIEADNSSSTDSACIGTANYDICGGALKLTGGNLESLFMRNSNQSINSLGLGNCGYSNFYRDVWFNFDVANSGTFNLSLLEREETTYLLELYQGDCQNLSFLDCYEFNEEFEINKTDLAPNTTIYGRLREASNRNSGRVQLIVDATATETVSVPETTTLVNTFELFPNPVLHNQSTVIELDLQQASFANLVVVDLNGQVVHQIANTRLPQGTTKFTIPSNLFSVGLYLIQLQTEKGIITKKLLVSE